MIFGTAGLAYGSVSHSFNYGDLFLPTGGAGGFLSPATTAGLSFGNTSVSHIQFGWTAGGGLEWSPMSLPNWSDKVEYLYTNLGSTCLSTLGTTVIPVGFSFLIGGSYP